MIVFLVTHRSRYTLDAFFRTWGAELRPRIRVRCYEDLVRIKQLPGAATYVFTDLERLSPAGLPVAGDVADLLERAPWAPTVINHPRRALGRYDLLRTMYERGLNGYRVHRAIPIPTSLRFPVFLRDEHRHRVLSPMLWTRAEVEQAIRGAGSPGDDSSALLLVEFEDTRDAHGVFRLYTGYVIGQAFVPGILSFDTEWVVKFGREALTSEQLAEQRAAALSREHESFLCDVAKLARTQYGRFDYALADGRICVWELNTNPMLLMPESFYPAETHRDREPTAKALLDAFTELAGDPDGKRPRVRIDVAMPDEPLVARVREPWHDAAIAQLKARQAARRAAESAGRRR